MRNRFPLLPAISPLLPQPGHGRLRPLWTLCGEGRGVVCPPLGGDEGAVAPPLLLPPASGRDLPRRQAGYCLSNSCLGAHTPSEAGRGVSQRPLKG